MIVDCPPISTDSEEEYGLDGKRDICRLQYDWISGMHECSKPDSPPIRDGGDGITIHECTGRVDYIRQAVILAYNVV
jgi:hypothetical protein